MHFGENQLSRSLIGLSPLPTTHPPGFQPRWVRASTTSYSRFTLAMGRSLRFGSTPRDEYAVLEGRQRPVRTRFRYGYPTRVNLATERDSQAHSSKGTPSPPPTTPKGDGSIGSDGLEAHGFRYSFTPLPGYFSSFPHGTIRYRSPGRIQAYRVVPADSQHIPRRRCYSGIIPTTRVMFSRTGLSPTTAAHPRNVPLTPHTRRQGSGRTPTSQPHNPASATPAEDHTNTV